MKITFTHEAWKKINTYIKLTDEEISGLGISSMNEAGDEITIRDVRIWKQECTATTTEIIDNKHLIDMVEEYQKEGVPMEDMNVWWHSHADMGVFWSATDQETIDNWFNEKYLVAVVGNKKKEFKGQISLKKPMKLNVDDVAIEYEAEPEPEPTKYEKAILKDIEEKIIEAPVVSYYIKDKGKGKDIPKGSLAPFDNGHDIYQKQTHGMHDEDRVNELRACAVYCACEECEKYIDGKRKKFPFKSHMYDHLDQTWKSLELFNDETMDRQYNMGFNSDWKEEMKWQEKMRKDDKDKLPIVI